MITRIYTPSMGLCTLVILSALLSGCGVKLAPTGITALSITPDAASFDVGARLTFSLRSTGTNAPTGCSWSSSDNSILTGGQSGSFVASGPGTATVSALCGAETASATISVTSGSYSAPITITRGGVYSGRWKSNSPTTAAVTIATDEPVVIENSVLTGPWSLIFGTGSSLGINLTVRNVLGIGLNPNVAGQTKGDFMDISNGASVQVSSSTMKSLHGGVVVLNSSPTLLSIHNNQAVDMDDRESDGKGGMLMKRVSLGHTFMLTNVNAIHGADISWNQVINTPGVAYTEDVISVYNSSGTARQPISIHDNYIQGVVGQLGVGYSGAGIVTDGYPKESSAGGTAFVDIFHNQIVETQNTGIGLGFGHDVNVHNNRVISSGRAPDGTWLDSSDGNGAAYTLWNFYDSSYFYNNQVHDNYAGLVRLGESGSPLRSDLFLISASAVLNNTAKSNTFCLPALNASVPNLAQEHEEYIAWLAKLATAGKTTGSSASLVP